MERRTLIRLLLGLAFGVPIAVEGGTLLGLFGQQLSGKSRASGSTATGPSGVGVGDELLESTDVSETVIEAIVTARDDHWAFTLTVTVENTTEQPYRLVLGTVTTESGKRVAGQFQTEVPPGRSRTVTGTWRLPEGGRPDSVQVAAFRENSRLVETTVDLGSVPVRS